jgi:hypothetical protein
MVEEIPQPCFLKCCDYYFKNYRKLSDAKFFEGDIGVDRNVAKILQNDPATQFYRISSPPVCYNCYPAFTISTDWTNINKRTNIGGQVI